MSEFLFFYSETRAKVQIKLQRSASTIARRMFIKSLLHSYNVVVTFVLKNTQAIKKLEADDPEDADAARLKEIESIFSQDTEKYSKLRQGLCCLKCIHIFIYAPNVSI